MRIAVCSDFFEPELSGVTDAIILQAQALMSRGHEVLFLAPSYPQRVHLARAERSNRVDTSLVSNAPVVRMPAMDYPFAPNQQSRIALPSLSASRTLRAYKPDLIHTHSPFVPGVTGLLTARKLGAPLVATHHTPFSEFMGRTPGWIVSCLERYVAWYYNHAVFVSAPCWSLLNFMKLQGLSVPHGPIPNPVALDDFTPAGNAMEKQTLKRKFGLSRFTILCTGRLAPEKHVDLVIRALAEARRKLPNMELAITGKGSAEKSLRQLCGRLGLGDSVRFFGLLDYPDLVELYKAADAFAMMSTAESQSLSLMQAMASGLPSVVANTRAFPEYVDGKNGRLVEQGDVNQLADELLSIALDAEHARQMGRQALASVGDYTPEAIGEQWEDVYSLALAGKVPWPTQPQVAH